MLTIDLLKGIEYRIDDGEWTRLMTSYRLQIRNNTDVTVNPPTPNILSPASASFPENDASFAQTFTTDIPVDRIIFDGGPDDAFFQLDPSANLTFLPGFIPDYDDPDDTGLNNTYVVYLKPISFDEVTGPRFTYTLTITDVVEVVVGDATMGTVSAVSESEIQILDIVASNATAFEADVDASGSWIALVAE